MKKFSILIPTWNNLEMLKLCVESIEQNSYFEHQILIYINEGVDGTLDWVKENGYQYIASEVNVGVCYSLNSLRGLVATDYMVFSNDDMYLLPNWDLYLWEHIEQLGHNKFFLSSTLLQPRKFYCKSVISPADFGQSVESFRKEELLENYNSYEHKDWYGSTWPVNIVHTSVWDLVGGYSVEYTPGMYSDPDFSAKLYLAGVRYFRGISKSRVYHFEASSTGRVVKNKGSRQFLNKWGVTSRTFVDCILRRGEPIEGEYSVELDVRKFKKMVFRSKMKRVFSSFKLTGAQREIYKIPFVNNR